jgi:hypothetical protein
MDDSLDTVLGCLREFPCDLLKVVRLEYDLRPCLADDIAVELLAFYDQARIAEARRDILIYQVASNERATFLRCDEICQFDSTKILNEEPSFHHI